MRAYELMVIADGDLEEAQFSEWIDRIGEQAATAGAQVKSTDKWGKRRFAYEINHKHEGYYVVFEMLAQGGALDELERNLRLADDIVRHKLIRLPDHEADRRGLLQAAPSQS